MQSLAPKASTAPQQSPQILRSKCFVDECLELAATDRDQAYRSAGAGLSSALLRYRQQCGKRFEASKLRYQLRRESVEAVAVAALACLHLLRGEGPNIKALTRKTKLLMLLSIPADGEGASHPAVRLVRHLSNALTMSEVDNGDGFVAAKDEGVDGCSPACVALQAAQLLWSQRHYPEAKELLRSCCIEELLSVRHEEGLPGNSQTPADAGQYQGTLRESVVTAGSLFFLQYSPGFSDGDQTQLPSLCLLEGALKLWAQCAMQVSGVEEGLEEIRREIDGWSPLAEIAFGSSTRWLSLKGCLTRQVVAELPPLPSPARNPRREAFMSAHASTIVNGPVAIPLPSSVTTSQASAAPSSPVATAAVDAHQPASSFVQNVMLTLTRFVTSSFVRKSLRTALILLITSLLTMWMRKLYAGAIGGSPYSRQNKAAVRRSLDL